LRQHYPVSRLVEKLDKKHFKQLKMKNLIKVLIVLTFLSSCSSKEKIKTTTPKQVNITTSDSIKLFGDLYHKNKSSKSILLFHQGGSNVRGEYRRIMPYLLNRDYNILAVDLRLGGQTYGSYNRTLAELKDYNPFVDEYGYCDAYNNLEASLEYLIDEGYNNDIIVWGSSFSAALAIQLAAKRGNDISKVLAFSPPSSSAMQDCKPIKYFQEVKIPTLIIRPKSEADRETVLIQIDSAKKYNIRTYVASNGVHGSSILDSVRVGSSTEASWREINAFLKN